MATTTNDIAFTSPSRIGVQRLALTGGISATIFYVFCWIGAQIPLTTLSHMYVGLFTRAEPSSAAALAEGTFWSLGFGLIMGILIAVVYNALSALDRR